ncbi:hypothetical protein ACVW1C_006964 [Bradyrhizobium sp. USDA 4011]
MNSNGIHQRREASPAARFRKVGLIAASAFVLGSVSPVQGQQGTLKPDTIDNTRDMRFCEILVVKFRGIEVYNTTGVSDCSAQLWNALDLRKLRRRYHALKVEKNGPHFWMMDTQTVLFGEKASFGGVEARWVARLPLLTALEAATGSKPYKVFSPKKTQKMVYAKGKPVYELIDPDGNVYVLQAHEAKFPTEALAELGEKLKLPSGWKFRTRDLSEDLVLDLKSDQTIYAIGDEYHQYWTRIPNYRPNKS